MKPRAHTVAALFQSRAVPRAQGPGPTMTIPLSTCGRNRKPVRGPPSGFFPWTTTRACPKNGWIRPGSRRPPRPIRRRTRHGCTCSAPLTRADVHAVWMTRDAASSAAGGPGRNSREPRHPEVILRTGRGNLSSPYSGHALPQNASIHAGQDSHRLRSGALGRG